VGCRPATAAPEGPAHRPAVPPAVRRVTTVVALWGVTAALLAGYATRHHGFDLDIYRDALHWWWDGNSLYTYRQPRAGGLGFVYPPFAALVLTPFAVLPFTASQLAMTAVNLTIVAVGGWWLARPVAARLGWPDWFTVALVLPLGVALEPVRETLGFGQVNLLLAALVLLDATLLVQGRRAVAGIGIGLAAAIKLTPAIFLLYLALGRQWRPALNAAAAAAGATLVAAAVDLPVSWQFWTQTVWATSRIGRPDSTPNQSLLGLVARLADDPAPPRWVWLVGAAALLGVGMTRALRAHAAGRELTAFTLVGLTGCLLSPISWTHHLVWVVPAVVLLAGEARDRRRWRPVLAAGVVYVVFASSVVWWRRRDAFHHWDLGPLGIVQENLYVLVVIALVLLLPTGSGRNGDQATTSTRPVSRSYRPPITTRSASSGSARRRSTVSRVWARTVFSTRSPGRPTAAR
jgi:alpha-1,2-mannosyltransferase